MGLDSGPGKLLVSATKRWAIFASPNVFETRRRLLARPLCASSSGRSGSILNPGYWLMVSGPFDGMGWGAPSARRVFLWVKNPLPARKALLNPRADRRGPRLGFEVRVPGYPVAALAGVESSQTRHGVL